MPHDKSLTALRYSVTILSSNRDPIEPYDQVKSLIPLPFSDSPTDWVALKQDLIVVDGVLWMWKCLRYINVCVFGAKINKYIYTLGVCIHKLKNCSKLVNANIYTRNTFTVVVSGWSCLPDLSFPQVSSRAIISTLSPEFLFLVFTNIKIGTPVEKKDPRSSGNQDPDTHPQPRHRLWPTRHL